jgi:GntR family transcriptional regulator
MAEKLASLTLSGVAASIVPLPPARRSARAARVRDLLREQILADRYEGGMLPGEPALMLEYGASRGQIREALQLLRDEGFIQRRQGTGTFVIRQKARHRFDRVHGVGDSFRRRPVVRGEMVSVERVHAPQSVTDSLRLPAGSSCTYAEFRTYVDGIPFNINSSYLPPALAGVLRLGAFDGDFYQYLEAHGTAVVAGEIVVEAVIADDLTAEAIGVAPGAAVMLFRRLLFTTGDQPVEFGFVRCRADRLALAVKLPRCTEESMWLAS